MKKLHDDFSIQINKDEEIAACADLLSKHWNFSYCDAQDSSVSEGDKVRRFVEIVFDKSLPFVKDRYHNSSVDTQISKRYRARRENLKISGCGAGIELFDGVCILLSRLKDDRIYKSDQEFYDQAVDSVITSLESEFKGLEFLVPNEYRDYMTAFRGGDNSNSVEKSSVNAKQLMSDFNGTESLGFYDLPDDISLHAIAFNEQKGQLPFRTLVGALVGQALSVGMVNNTVELMRELRAVDIGQNFLDCEYRVNTPKLKELSDKALSPVAANRSVLPILLKEYRPRVTGLNLGI